MTRETMSSGTNAMATVIPSESFPRPRGDRRTIVVTGEEQPADGVGDRADPGDDRAEHERDTNEVDVHADLRREPRGHAPQHPVLSSPAEWARDPWDPPPPVVAAVVETGLGRGATVDQQGAPGCHRCPRAARALRPRLEGIRCGLVRTVRSDDVRAV